MQEIFLNILKLHEIKSPINKAHWHNPCYDSKLYANFVSGSFAATYGGCRPKLLKKNELRFHATRCVIVSLGLGIYQALPLSKSFG